MVLNVNHRACPTIRHQNKPHATLVAKLRKVAKGGVTSGEHNRKLDPQGQGRGGWGNKLWGRIPTGKSSLVIQTVMGKPSLYLELRDFALSPVRN
jgi:hypothetical protein